MISSNKAIIIHIKRDVFACNSKEVFIQRSSVHTTVYTCCMAGTWIGVILANICVLVIIVIANQPDPGKYCN